MMAHIYYSSTSILREGIGGRICFLSLNIGASCSMLWQLVGVWIADKIRTPFAKASPSPVSGVVSQFLAFGGLRKNDQRAKVDWEVKRASPPASDSAGGGEPKMDEPGDVKCTHLLTWFPLAVHFWCYDDNAAKSRFRR